MQWTAAPLGKPVRCCCWTLRRDFRSTRPRRRDGLRSPGRTSPPALLYCWKMSRTCSRSPLRTASPSPLRVQESPALYVSDVRAAFGALIHERRILLDDGPRRSDFGLEPPIRLGFVDLLSGKLGLRAVAVGELCIVPLRRRRVAFEGLDGVEIEAVHGSVSGSQHAVLTNSACAKLTHMRRGAWRVRE